MRRVVVLLLALAGCKDKAGTPTVNPVGSGAVATTDAKPPAKSPPLDAAKAQQLAQQDVTGWTKTIKLADAKGLELRFDRAPLGVTVQASKCFDCLPMSEAKWRAKSDALRGLIAPELRDHKDTTWELGITDLAGVRAAWTYHVGYKADAHGTAYALYFNDGTNMIRVVAEFAGAPPASREAMIATAPREMLALTAKQFADQFVHAW